MFTRFVSHPASVGETYSEHQRTALRFASALLRAGLACLVHAFLPWMFETTGSRAVKRLHEEMTRRK